MSIENNFVDDKEHKPKCERAFTLLHRHTNCVIHMDLLRKKPDEKKPVEEARLPPITLTDLEKSEQVTYGEGDLEFTQNSVPFDFNGDYLLWMEYKEKGERAIFLFDFANNKKETAVVFGPKDGIISHCKLSGSKQEPRIFYVKDCKQIMVFDVRVNDSKMIGKTPDAVLAMHISEKRLRACDREGVQQAQQQIEENKRDDLESQRGERQKLIICTVDDSETLSLFEEKGDPSLKPTYQCKIKQAIDAPYSLKTKSLFGLGYPYLVCAYGNHVAVSTDFGICLLALQ